MNRFEKENVIWNIIKRIPFTLILTLFFFIICFYGIQSVDKNTSERQLESLNQAVQRSIIQCYAVEGTYPPSLSYLKEHYGIYYDEECFFVDYQPGGANLRPDVTILPIK